MSYKKIYSFSLILFLSMLILLPGWSQAQIVRATGSTTEASSQLVYYYDQAGGESTVIQVTNTNDTTAVWVHVQLFRSYDPDNNASSGSTADPVFCEERDFIDFLTPNDTHVYDLGDDSFDKNVGETENDPGESTSIVDTSGTKGFVIITPVVSESDLSAIAFEHMVGASNDDSADFRMNAMGRNAVDFATGHPLSDGTVLDGVTGGFVLLQPLELLFDFESSGSSVDIVGIAFSDTYGPAGLQGYAVVPADATWTTFIFDFKEDPTSCGVRTVACFLTLGLNEDIGQNNTEFVQSISDDLLCSAASSIDYPDTCPNCNNDIGYLGWTRIFVSGLTGLENHLGLIFNDDDEGAAWMFTNK